MTTKTMFAGMFVAAAALVGTGAQAGGKAAAVTPAARAWTQADLTKAIGPKNYTAFLAACKAAFVDENCSFLKSTADYKAQSDNKKRGVLAEQIMNYYVGSAATKEVNIPAAESSRLVAAYAAAKKSKTYAKTMFDESIATINALQLLNINKDNPKKFAATLVGLK